MYTTSLADGNVTPPQVIVGGRLAQVLYFGAAPGYPGYYHNRWIRVMEIQARMNDHSLQANSPAPDRTVNVIAAPAWTHPVCSNAT
jgi:hypothetical protein